jgi:RNA polymerase sigma-70 factor (ECF subfamily)
MDAPADPLEKWLRAARAGSRSALGRALDAARPLLMQIAADELGADLRGKVGASDVVQESMADAVRGFGQFQGVTPADWLAWLGQVLRHNLRDCARRYRGADKRDVRREVPLAAGSASSAPALPLAADDTGPDGALLAAERAQRLERAVARLSEEHQQALRLRNQEDLSFEEVGRRLGRSAEAARKLWARALARLAEALGESP